MNLILLGPQGSGKGTQVELIRKKHDFVCFESGKELRLIAQKPITLGREIRQVLESGELISDEHIYFLTKDWLSQVPPEKNVLFDGCPRRLSQARDLEGILADRNQQVDLVIYLVVPDEVATARLLGRLLCQSAEHVYNIQTNPPKVSGICDIDGSPLAPRTDETSETIKRRLVLFHQETEPLLQYYNQTRLVHEINGNRPVSTVFADIDSLLSDRFSSLSK
jgi:adenylate kinase